MVITVFVILWLALFHYESLRYNFLSRVYGHELPKFKFLFPPAGWIMFFNVGESEVRAEVYGRKGENIEFIDPHRIFDDHWLGYDNIHRNVLVTVLDARVGEAFGRYLRRKFPEYEGFYVMQVVIPSNIRFPGMKKTLLAYTC